MKPTTRMGMHKNKFCFNFCSSQSVAKQVQEMQESGPRSSGQKVFFKTDNQFNLYQTAKGTQPAKFNINADNNNLNVHKPTSNLHEGSVNIIESNMSRGSSRNYSRIQERMRSKYIGNIKIVREQLGESDGQLVTYQQNKKQGYDNLYMPPNILQFNDYCLAPKPVVKQVEPQSRILIEKTLTKPKFSFKPENDDINQQTFNTDDGLISFDSSSLTEAKLKGSASLNSSKSASNFSDILKVQQDKVNMRMIKNGDMEGYMLSRIDKKEQNISKKLQQIKKSNQAYDQKIRQKQREIELVRKKMQKQKNQLLNYQSKMIQAYDNIEEDPNSLLLSSRNYEASNEKMQIRTKNKNKVFCGFEGMAKKLCKQIIYGRCMILESDLLQIGFDNKIKQGLFELFFTVKENLIQMQVSIENCVQYGFVVSQEDMLMRVRNIPAGKKIKRKIVVDYVGTANDKVGLMNLKVIMLLNHNSSFTQTLTLPFSLYRNFITQSPKTQQKKSIQPSPIQKNFDYPILTQWYNSCDELIKNPKGYLDTLFKTGYWVDENIYHVDLIFKNMLCKPINILVNCRNFAIQMKDVKNLDVVTAVGNFMAREKDKEASRSKNYSRVLH